MNPLGSDQMWREGYLCARLHWTKAWSKRFGSRSPSFPPEVVGYKTVDGGDRFGGPEARYGEGG